MRRAIVSVGLALVLMAAAVSMAAAQTAPPNPNRPAATLLLPYFEVDLENAQGMTTLFTVNNASATAILTHVTLWSDLGIPVLSFPIYLTGYDVVSMNLRDLLNGTLPRSASAGQDPGNLITPQGPISQDINFASCTGRLPIPPLPAVYLPYLRAALTGGPSSFHSGSCVSRNLGTPGIARGYITVNTVNSCPSIAPADPGYFASVATFQNTLWGDYLFLNPSQELAYGDPLVHIRADQFATDPELSVPGEYTFYGRFVAWAATDRREPLATNFATRFVSPKEFKTPAKARRRAAFPPGTELLVWRDPKVAPAANPPFTCGGNPSWYPLTQEQVRVFDEQENTELPTSAQLFPAATQRVTLSTTSFPVTFASGWLFLNLNTAVAPAGPNPPEDPLASQAWVTVLHRVLQGENGGRYEVGFRAIRLDSAQNASHTTIP